MLFRSTFLLTTFGHKQIEHKRLKVQHKKDKERDRYVAAPSPRMMGPAATAGRMQQTPQHFRQPLLPQHNSALRHHPVRRRNGTILHVIGGDDKSDERVFLFHNSSFEAFRAGCLGVLV